MRAGKLMVCGGECVAGDIQRGRMKCSRGGTVAEQGTEEGVKEDRKRVEGGNEKGVGAELFTGTEATQGWQGDPKVGGNELQLDALADFGKLTLELLVALPGREGQPLLV